MNGFRMCRKVSTSSFLQVRVKAFNYLCRLIVFDFENLSSNVKRGVITIRCWQNCRQASEDGMRERIEIVHNELVRRAARWCVNEHELFHFLMHVVYPTIYYFYHFSSIYFRVTR